VAAGRQAARGVNGLVGAAAIAVRLGRASELGE
jgi:hypothetical protein